MVSNKEQVIANLNATLQSLEEVRKSLTHDAPHREDVRDRLYDIRKQVEQLRDTYGQPNPAAVRAYHIVWNEAKTEGFVTTDGQLAYEVRKGAVDNCYNGELEEQSVVGIAFAEKWVDDNCTIETVVPKKG